MDPTLKNRTLSTLKSRFDDLSPRMKSAAKYVIDHPADFGLDQIRDTARKSGVSTNTLIRLAKVTGFDSFEQMREPFRHALVSAPQSGRSEWLEDLRAAGDIGRVQAEAAQNAIAIVTRSLERQTPEQMERVANLLLGASRVYLTAYRASFSVAHNFHYIARMVLPSLDLIPRHMNSTIDDLNDATPDDVLIAIATTPYSIETVEACKFARAKGVKLVLISDSDMISPDFMPDEALVASTLSTHHFCCYAGIISVVENLIATLVHLGGADAAKRIKNYEDVRNENNSYWNPKKTNVF